MVCECSQCGKNDVAMYILHCLVDGDTYAFDTINCFRQWLELNPCGPGVYSRVDKEVEDGNKE